MNPANDQFSSRSRSGQERISAPAAQDAAAFLRRRRNLFFYVAWPIVLGMVLFAYRLPSIYQSEAKVLIEQPSIPEDIVASTITSYVDERIQSVSQRVMAADNVSKLIEEFSLYPELVSEGVNQTAIEEFRLDTDLQNIAAEIFDARRGRMDGSTFAFVVGFRHTDPAIAQQVTSSLVQLYLDENVKSRTEISAETTRFLEQQAERISSEISRIEQNMADFKAQYAGALPERTQLNFQLLDRAERDLTEVENEIRLQTSERAMVLNELRGMSPYASFASSQGGQSFGAQDRLQSLRIEYMRLTSTYGLEHPDVIRTKREIDAIVGGTSSQSSDEVVVQLARLRVERDQLLDKYSAAHPDVLRIDRSIELLEVQLSVITDSTAASGGNAPPPTNPEYVQKQLQIDGINSRLTAAQRDRSQLLSKRMDLETNISIAPRVEKEWLELDRGYGSLREEFEEIKMRISEATISQRLESENKGERFTLLERASLPNIPVEPNRFAMIFLGVILAIGGGIGMAALADGFDSTVRSGRDLEQVYGTTPLVAIPFIETSSDKRQRLFKQSAIAFLFVISIVVVAVSV